MEQNSVYVVGSKGWSQNSLYELNFLQACGNLGKSFATGHGLVCSGGKRVLVILATQQDTGHAQPAAEWYQCSQPLTHCQVTQGITNYLCTVLPLKYIFKFFVSKRTSHLLSFWTTTHLGTSQIIVNTLCYKYCSCWGGKGVCNLQPHFWLAFSK